MPVTRPRAESTEGAPPAKRQKGTHASDPATADPSTYFATGLLEDAVIERLASSYRESGPFLHVVVDKLFQDNLLAKVKDECIGELSFTEKETDIYKVHQTGDLASLSYLSEDQVALLPNLLKLRDALYSPVFRSFLRRVTGCGPLSGTKQDMSVNSYKKGCHLLNHDDVIGTRRVSYILYMPLPQSQEWRTEWGGALELYPVKLGSEGIEEPENIPSKSIPPSWNQFIFFEVQPGHSFHSVEEVVVDEDGCDRQRLSISGWFHKAQEGEDGYEATEEAKPKSSLEQLTSTSTVFSQYPDAGNDLMILASTPLSEDDISFLSAFLDPIYLQPKVLKSLAQSFITESSLQLHKFLCEPLAAKLEKGLRGCDRRDGLDGESRQGCIAPHTSGVAQCDKGTWTLQGPPHKARYCTLSSNSSSVSDRETLATLSSNGSTPEQILQVLQDRLFPSHAFRIWLAIIGSLIPVRYAVEARRFRPGFDYTLAMSDEETVLDVVLGLTPEAEDGSKKEKEKANGSKGKGKAKATDEEEDEDEGEPRGWERGEWGGWECYMAPHDGDEDPAVYRSGPIKEKVTSNNAEKSEFLENHQNSASSSAEQKSAVGEANEEDDEMASFKESGDEDTVDDDEGDGTLLTVQPGFNRLLLVLREKGVMRFVKYVSASAPGSRWDISGEYEIVCVEEDGEGESHEGEEQLDDV